jgi:serine O-acetyltransferase
MTDQTYGTSHQQPGDEQPTTPPGTRALIFADVAWYGPPGWVSVIKAALTQRTYRPVLTLRLCQATSGPLRVLSVVAHRWACGKAGIDLPHSLDAGPGLKLTHGWGVVVNPGVRLGRNVILMHGATIGRSGVGVPVIGDDVFVGPQASVLGGVDIGKGATISAGCVITQDVAAHTMVMLDRASLTSREYERPPEKPDWT